jgi:hypothetical protein
MASFLRNGQFYRMNDKLNRGSAQHSCTIPPGKTLAIPLSNVWRDNVCENPQLSQDDLKAFVEATASSASKLKASIDGKNIPGINTQNNRAGPAGPFSYTIPSSATDNVLSTLLSAAYGKVVPIPGKCPNGAPDVTSRTINGAWADGYYFTVPPLPPLPGGKAHTINFGGTMLYGGPGGAPVTQNITYDITVS